MTRVNIKQLFKNVSSKLMQEFQETEKTLNFPPDRGGQREEAIRKFLSEKLPRRYRISKGFVVSYKGIQSDQCDVIICDAATSPIFYTDVDQEILPVESVYAVIQVKSRLTPTSLDKAIKNIKSFKQVPRKDVISETLGLGGSISIKYNQPINRKVGVLMSYSLGRSYDSKPIDQVSAEIIEKVKKENINDRIDFVCIIDRGVIVPVKQQDQTLMISIFDDTADVKMVGNAENSMGLFFVILLSTLNGVKLEQPDLFAYFNQE
ncbi:hypothetical protein KKG61_01985 [bacterium]|nr:hypothetical protein [Patescibacteria group bacterium]MBU1262409.1 hypothetical protein [bacterium]MBU1598870.1 hypothetical protein [bacterium]